MLLHEVSRHQLAHQGILKAFYPLNSAFTVWELYVGSVRSREAHTRRDAGIERSASYRTAIVQTCPVTYHGASAVARRSSYR
jgi:hypothetical protein